MRQIIFSLLFSAFMFGLDYSLEDVNTTSPTYQNFVGPSYFQNNDFSDHNKLVSINYFGWETWNSWRPLFAQLCDLSNQGVWDTTNAILIGVGIGAGGNNGLSGMIDQDGVNAPWVQDPSEEIWDQFLGENAPRRQIVLLDSNLEKRFQEQYGSQLSPQEEIELLTAIQELIDEASTILGDLNDDDNLNILDVIILVDMSLGGAEIDLNGDINGDGGINVLDIVLLVNLILSN